MARFFTRDQAHRLLPQVERLIRSSIALKSELESSQAELRTLTTHITVSGGARVDPNRASVLRKRRDDTVAQLKHELENIQEVGCLVKDLDIGLVDFPTLYQGTEVYLCWKLGESEIAFWHGIDEGFRGRKAIDDEFLANHSDREA